MRYIRRSVALVAVLVSLAACQDSTHQDAPSNVTNTGPADVMFYPAGFRNVAHKCDGPNMVYVTSSGQGDTHPSGVFVVANDPRCKV